MTTNLSLPRCINYKSCRTNIVNTLWSTDPSLCHGELWQQLIRFTCLSDFAYRYKYDVGYQYINRGRGNIDLHWHYISVVIETCFFITFANGECLVIIVISSVGLFPCLLVSYISQKKISADFDKIRKRYKEQSLRWKSSETSARSIYFFKFCGWMGGGGGTNVSVSNITGNASADSFVDFQFWWCTESPSRSKSCLALVELLNSSSLANLFGIYQTRCF